MEILKDELPDHCSCGGSAQTNPAGSGHSIKTSPLTKLTPNRAKVKSIEEDTGATLITSCLRYLVAEQAIGMAWLKQELQPKLHLTGIPGACDFSIAEIVGIAAAIRAKRRVAAAPRLDVSPLSVVEGIECLETELQG